MNIKVWRLRIIQWLLLLAIGLQGLGPAFAGLAFSSADNRLQIVVCTSAGMVIMDLPADGETPDNLRIHETGDCVLCATAPALPASVAVSAVSNRLAVHHPLIRVTPDPPSLRLTDSWAWPPGLSPPSSLLPTI